MEGVGILDEAVGKVGLSGVGQIDFAVGEFVATAGDRGLELQGLDSADALELRGGDNHLTVAVVVHAIARDIRRGGSAILGIADGDGITFLADYLEGGEEGEVVRIRVGAVVAVGTGTEVVLRVGHKVGEGKVGFGGSGNHFIALKDFEVEFVNVIGVQTIEGDGSSGGTYFVNGNHRIVAVGECGGVEDERFAEFLVADGA